jgi:hypothetical protein
LVPLVQVDFKFFEVPRGSVMVLWQLDPV